MPEGGEKQKGRRAESWGPAAAYLGEQQGALAGLQALGALGAQLGVSHLFTSVRGKGKLGN